MNEGIRFLPLHAAAAGVRATQRGVHFAASCLPARFPVFWLRGTARPSGRPATLLVAGREPWVHYLPTRFFDGAPRQERIGRASLWTLPYLLRRLRSSADLTIARVDRTSATLFFGGDYLRVPEWIRTGMAIPDDLEAHVRSRGGRKGDVRLIQRERLRPVVSHDEGDFDAFYQQMYLPYIHARYGKLDFSANEHTWRGRFRRGGILWVKKDAERLAGMLFEINRGVFHVLALGTAAGAAQPRQHGALAAAYYYALDHARRQGCAWMNHGGSRPSLHDGVFRYKRKWGATLSEARNNCLDLLVHWNRMDGMVADFLSHTSLIFRDRDGLSGLGALRTPAPATAIDVAETHRRLWTSGLRRLYLFNAAGWQDGLTPPQGVELLAPGCLLPALNDGARSAPEIESHD